MAETVQLALTAVIVAVTGGTPRFVVLHDPAASAALGLDFRPLVPINSDLTLPSSRFRPTAHRTLQDGVRDLVEQQTGLLLRYVEQLYTFGDRYRHRSELLGAVRTVAIGYLALVREAPLHGGASTGWMDYYAVFPWEDWRRQRPPSINALILPALDRWIKAGDDHAMRIHRAERAAIAFADGGIAWDTERVLERYELLYEAGMITESKRDRRLLLGAGKVAGVDAGAGDGGDPPELGRPMIGDSRRLLATALARLRGKLKYRPIVFEVLPPMFTLLQLQQVVEALSGQLLHKQNFRRLMIGGGLVEATGTFESQTGGRPAELYRFRREVILERTSAHGSPGAPVP